MSQNEITVANIITLLSNSDASESAFLHGTHMDTHMEMHLLCTQTHMSQKRVRTASTMARASNQVGSLVIYWLSDLVQIPSLL